MHVGAASSSTNMVVAGVWPGGTPSATMLGGPRLSTDHQITVQQQSQRDSMGYGASKGLLNGPGQNNCFLNCAVQVRLTHSLLSQFSILSIIHANSHIMRGRK